MGKLGRGVSLVFVAQLVRMATRGALLIILTRFLLAPAAYGRLFLTISVLTVAMLFANLGLAKAGARYLTEFRETEPELVPTILRKTLLYNVTAIAIVCAGLVLLHSEIAEFVGEPTIAGLILLGTAYVVVKSLSETAVVLFQGFNRMKWVAVIRVVSNTLVFVAVPVFIVLDLGLSGAILGYILGYLVTVVIGLGVIFRRFYSPSDVTPQKAREVSKRIVEYSVPLTMTMGANVINGRVDTILLSVFRGPTAIGFYTLGKQIAGFVIAPALSLGFGISPTFGEEKASDNLRPAARLYERSLTYIGAVYAPAAAGIVLVADPGIRHVFGASYAGAVPVLQIFSVFVFIRSIDAITSDALDYMGRARTRAIAKGGVALGNIVLNLILIPPFGLIGATVATVITYAVYVTAEVAIMFDELPLDGRKLARSGALVAGITAGMSVVVYTLIGVISGLPSLVGVVATGGGVWLGLTLVTGLIDYREVKTALL